MPRQPTFGHECQGRCRPAHSKVSSSWRTPAIRNRILGAVLWPLPLLAVGCLLPSLARRDVLPLLFPPAGGDLGLPKSLRPRVLPYALFSFRAGFWRSSDRELKSPPVRLH